MRYENLTVTENYTMIAKNLKKYFTDEPLAYMILEFLYDEALKFNSFGLLTEDMSFYCPVSKIIEMFDGNVSSKTVLEKIKIIEKRNFIKKTPSKILKRPSYYRINFEKIKEVAKDKKITVCNEVPQESAKETSVVAKNATVEDQDVYNLKPADNKEKSTELAIVEKSPTNQEYCERIKIAWNAIASRYETTPNITVVTETRLKHFKNILKYYKIDEKQFFNSVNKALSESKFLRGIGKKWRADFDFFINKSSYLKAIEGAYKDNPNEIMEILQDPAKMSFKEAQELRDKIEMERWLHDEEKEEPKALP